MFQHLLRIDHLSKEDVLQIFELAGAVKEKTKKGVPHRPLDGKVLAMIFEKSSTRTRVSFEVGMVQLGGSAFYMDTAKSQMGRGESIPDTAMVMSRYVDGVMIRAYSQEAVETFADYATVPVINGLTDRFHPCQILSDLFTVKEKLGSWDDRQYVYVGDGNNVANSLINAAIVTGYGLTLSCPEGYDPDPELLKRAGSRVRIERNPLEAVKDADIVYTDTWVSMGREVEQAEREKIFAPYQINEALLAEAPGDAVVMHCLPAHRGQEITDEVMDGPRSIVFDQAENRLHVQKAILEILIKK